MNIRLINAMMIALCISSNILSMEHQQIIKQEQEDSALIGRLPYRNGV